MWPRLKWVPFSWAQYEWKYTKTWCLSATAILQKCIKFSFLFLTNPIILWSAQWSRKFCTIGHFWVVLISFSKQVLVYSLSYERLCTWPHFEKEAQDKLEMAYLQQIFISFEVWEWTGILNSYHFHINFIFRLPQYRYITILILYNNITLQCASL